MANPNLLFPEKPIPTSLPYLDGLVFEDFDQTEGTCNGRRLHFFSSLIEMGHRDILTRAPFFGFYATVSQNLLVYLPSVLDV